jgi:polynucleotide 5'-kinase involved in rRNA processing
VLVASDEQACRRLQEAKEQLAKLLNKEVYVSCLSGVKGALVGLVNGQLEHVGVGVLEGIDVREGVIKLRTPFEVEGVRALIIGRLKISEEGVERERGAPPIA